MSPFRSCGRVNTRWKYGTGNTSRSARGEPGSPWPASGTRAMAVAAGVIDVARGAAGVAGLDMAAERGGAAGEDGAPDLRLGSRQAMGCEIGRTVTAQHLGQAHAAGGGNHADALSAWAGRAVPGERWCRSDGCAPDAHSAWWSRCGRGPAGAARWAGPRRLRAGGWRKRGASVWMPPSRAMPAASRAAA